MRSIERYLLGWIVGAMAVGTLLVAFATDVVILDEMNEIHDADLRNVAEALGRGRPSGPAQAQDPKPRQPSRSALPPAAEIVTLARPHDGRRASSTARAGGDARPASAGGAAEHAGGQRVALHRQPAAWWTWRPCNWTASPCCAW